MQVNVEKLGPCQVKVQFTVPSDEFHGAIRRALGEAGRNVRMKGFRPGHVPAKVVEKQFGEQIRREAIEHFARQAFDQAVKENSLKVVGFQRVDVSKLQILEGVDFSHAFEVSLRPEIQLGEYKGIPVESQLEAVMDPEVDSAIENLRREQATPEPAGDVGVKADGMVVAKVQWLLGEEVVLERADVRVSPETNTPGTDPAAFEQALLGARDGDVRDVPMTFPNEIADERLRGKSGITRIHVAQALHLNAPTEAELQKLIGARDEQDMRRIVREKLEEMKREQEQQRVDNVIVEQLIAAHPFDVPEMMLNDQTNIRLSQLHQQLVSQGATPEQATQQVESQRAPAKDAAAKGMRTLFLLQTIADKEKLLVTREDMQAEVGAIAERNQAPVEEVTEYYKKNNLFEQMAIEILDRKVKRFLRENAKITEPS
ncbi:MAG: trigger factor [Planctomycetota bacterium]